MTIKAVLWEYKPLDNGRCDIKLYTYHEGKKKYLSLGISVEPKDWDTKSQRVKKTHPLNEVYNAVIRKHALETEEKLLTGQNSGPHKKGNTPGLTDFISTYIEDTLKGAHDHAPGTVRNHRSTLKRLQQYEAHRGEKIRFEDVNQEFYTGFLGFVSGRYKLTKTGGFAQHIKNVKKFMSEAKYLGLHNHSGHLNRDFKVLKSKERKIYLNEDDVLKLETVDLSAAPWLDAERDRWLICYYFILRFQDGQDYVKKANFFQTGDRWFFRYTARKTNIEATVPVNAKAIAIMEKYDWDFPKSTNQVSNRQIKIVAVMAGLNEIVSENGIQGPKSQFVCTHTARRSAATNLSMQGVPLNFIAKLGGWVQLETLRKYLLANGLDVAQVVSDYSFFT